MSDSVQLTDLEVITRFSLAVRSATAERADVVAALKADLAWLEGRRTTAASSGPTERSTAPAAPAPAKKAAKAAPKKAAATKKAVAKKAARTR